MHIKRVRKSVPYFVYSVILSKIRSETATHY